MIIIASTSTAPTVCQGLLQILYIVLYTVVLCGSIIRTSHKKDKILKKKAHKLKKKGKY